MYNVFLSHLCNAGKTAEPIRMVEKLNGGKSGLDYVADQVSDAVCNMFPLARYVLGYDAQLMRFVIVYLPCWVVDWAQTLNK